jgi:PAS domain S-box-containing protein
MPLSSHMLVTAALCVAAFAAGLAGAYVFFHRERRGFVLELRSLWERLDAIFYRSPLAASLCEVDLEAGKLRVIDCNEQAAELHGGSRDNLLAEHGANLGETAVEVARAKLWLRLPRPAPLWHGEKLLKRLDGTEVPIAYVWSRVEIGERELVLMVERDISEQRRAEAALKESEQRFRRIVETADCLLWNAHVTAVSGRLEWKYHIPLSGLGARLCEATGLAFDEREMWKHFNLPERAEAEERCWDALMSNEPSYRQEFRVLLPRETVWLQEQVEIERLGSSEWNLVSVIVDITRLKETEAAMRISEDRNRLVLKASNDGIWDFDVAAGRMVTSDRCRAMLGLTPEQMPTTAEGWRERIHPDDLAVEAAAWKKHQGSGEPCVYQTRFKHQDGSWRWFMVRAMTVTNESGALIRVIGSHTDISELKRNDGELQQGRRLRAIGELVGGIAHEFNNLLTPMLLQTTMMRDGHAPGQDLKQQLKPVIDAVTAARELTQRILTFGRRSAVNAETLDIVAAVNEHLDFLRNTIDRRVRLEVIPAPTPLWVTQNRTDVAQVVINLVLNARDTLLEKASAEPPQSWVPCIEIRFATVDKPRALRDTADETTPASGPCHCLTVRDNGMGMSDEVRERLFEPFYTTKVVGQGTGLGLATVWHLVKTMGGRVEVDTVIGEGSAFHVLIPAAIGAAIPARPVPARSPRPTVSVNVARILVVDDQPAVAALLSRIFELWGHRVTVLEDGTAALNKLAQDPAGFDICVTDLNMPGATGFDVIRAIRDRNLAIKVVVMGGYITAEVRQTLDQLKIDAILPKPFSIEDIATALRACGR